MNLELLKSLVILTEAKNEDSKAPVKIAKEPEIVPAEDEHANSGLAPEKAAFFYRPKFDIYGNLEQTEDQDLRRETKRVYAMFGREHERGAVYGISSGSEREFKRTARLLGISTDGDVNLERVKRAGFTAAGRIGVKRLMKRGDYVVSLVGPSDDSTSITFYTAKPIEKLKESQSTVSDEVLNAMASAYADVGEGNNGGPGSDVTDNDIISFFKYMDDEMINDLDLKKADVKEALKSPEALVAYVKNYLGT